MALKKSIKRTLFVIASVVVLGMLVPQGLRMPVVGATANSYNHKTFWYYPWGTSVVHKGVDIFARKGTRINSATIGWVLYAGKMPGKGGNVAIVLGPKWRLHYYAHMDQVSTSTFAFVGRDSQIGTVGNSGNAGSTPSHLHYGLFSLIPYPWRIDSDHLGWQKMCYLNPIDYFEW